MCPSEASFSEKNSSSKRRSCRNPCPLSDILYALVIGENPCVKKRFRVVHWDATDLHSFDVENAVVSLREETQAWTAHSLPCDLSLAMEVSHREFASLAMCIFAGKVLSTQRI